MLFRSEPEPPRPGIRTGGLRLGAVLAAAGVVLAGIGIAAGASLARSGIEVDRPIGRIAAAAGLAIAIGAVAVCLGLAVLAMWSSRNRHRAPSRTVRNLLAVLAVATASLAAAMMVWTANAWITIGVSALWGKLQ